MYYLHSEVITELVNLIKFRVNVVFMCIDIPKCLCVYLLINDISILRTFCVLLYSKWCHVIIQITLLILHTYIQTNSHTYTKHYIDNVHTYIHTYNHTKMFCTITNHKQTNKKELFQIKNSKTGLILLR